MNNDDWSGEMQRACRFGTNLIQVSLRNVPHSVDYHRRGVLGRKLSGVDLFSLSLSLSSWNRNPSGFIHPHGMLHGLLTADQIDRGSMIISSKVFSFTRTSFLDLLSPTK